LLERPLPEPLGDAVAGSSVSIAMRPFEIVTLRFFGTRR
jgi:hypothetical protein